MTSVINAFTYNGWEADKAAIEKTLAKSSMFESSFVDQHAKQKLKAMENKQLLHDGNDGLHPGIARIQVPGAYTYDGIADDLKETFKQYMLGNDTLTDRLIQIIDFKEMMHNDDRSDPFLVELDSYTFCYPGWKDDKTNIEHTLATSLRSCVHHDVRRQLKGMERKQHIYEEEGYPSSITLLHSDVFSYPTFCKDKVAALEYYQNGDDVAYEHILNRIQSKQTLHDGDRSHHLLSELDLAEFTYPQWEEDRITVEDTLLHSVNSFAEYDAERLYRGMQNKQSFFSGIDLHPGISILRSNTFSYKGFKRDKRDAMNEYRAGYTSAFEKRLSRIQEKQKMQDGNRSNSYVTTLDIGATCTPSPKKNVTFNEDVQISENEEQILHDGDRSHLLLSALDFAKFTYPQWEVDRITVEDSLMLSVNSSDAQRLYRGMQNKQSFFSGIDLHPGISILRSNTFSYKGFKRDKRDAMNEYRAGYTSAFEKRLGRIQEKQNLHDGDHSNPVLTTLDVGATCTPSPKKNVTIHADVQIPENEEPRIIHTKDVERWVPDDCVICLSAPRTHIFAPCGHLCLCNSCAFKTPYRKRKRSKKHACPICRQTADSIVKIYF